MNLVKFWNDKEISSQTGLFKIFPILTCIRWDETYTYFVQVIDENQSQLVPNNCPEGHTSSEVSIILQISTFANIYFLLSLFTQELAVSISNLLKECTLYMVNTPLYSRLK